MPRKKSKPAADSEQLELTGAEPVASEAEAKQTQAKSKTNKSSAKSSKAKQAKKTKPPLTTAQQLGSILKSCRDIMRKDKGLNGDTDRLPMLTWIMFLKFLDDVERLRETEALLAGKRFKTAIAAPYRWRDWAANEAGITGDGLIAFIEQEQTVRPDGSEGAGLFAYLRGLQGADGKDRRDVIATVFKGAVNRMINGYLLRDVINKINGIQFQSTEEIHTLGRLYESMLKEMRDAAGDSGEFYTPRPVVQFMVQVLNPQLGETVLDPACGTGGFLLESFEHLKSQCQTVAEQEILQQCSLFGGEAKPLPYLLAQMNLLLHGLELPEIDAGNSLRRKLVELGDGDRVDIILTNPPFGGEEEKGIQGNFPPDKQTSETALLFLQLIMRLLKRKQGSYPGGRAGVVVPNGTLFGDGVCGRIKEQLLKEFNLHTIVRLPNGTFAPYTSIPTNLLFFERGGPTEEIWYYEQPLPEGRKNYTKTKPLRFEELGDCLAWWDQREETEQAWKVPVGEVLKYNEDGTLASVNLDIKNPRGTAVIEHRPPEELVASIQAKEQRILELSTEILATLAGTSEGTSDGVVVESDGAALTSVDGATDLSTATAAISPELPVARAAAEAGYGDFVADAVALLEAARGAAARSVNAVMTATYWELGRRIVEWEQAGKERAKYGEGLIAKLSEDLTTRLGRGFSTTNLKQMRSFYQRWEIGQRSKIGQHSEIGQTASDLFTELVGRFRLPWSHYVCLLGVEKQAARDFYEAEALRLGWTVRQLKRQVGSQFYERTLLSKNKAKMLEQAGERLPGEEMTAAEMVKDPYVLEFLDLRDEYSESDLEGALVAHLESFLLELGGDFAFVGRQRRLRVGDEWFRVDLLFFHRRLRCLVVIDLKLGEFSHADSGQMNLYLNYAREHWMNAGENPPVGLILCNKKDAAVAHYALAGLENQVLAAEYRMLLPDEELLAAELEKTRKLLEGRS